MGAKLAFSVARQFVLVALVALLSACVNGDYLIYKDLMRPRFEIERRWETDLKRDANNRPLEVLFFFNIVPGMDVLSVRDSGYFTEILALAVGDESVVYSHHPSDFAHADLFATIGEYERRFEGGRFNNVIRLKKPINEITFEDRSLDFVLLHLSLHDLLTKYGEEGAGKLFENFQRWLRPGGSIGIIDHLGRIQGADAGVHRLDVSTSLPWLWKMPALELEQSVLLRNFKDNGVLFSQDVAIAGRTDRIMLRLIKNNVNLYQE